MDLKQRARLFYNFLKLNSFFSSLLIEVLDVAAPFEKFVDRQ